MSTGFSAQVRGIVRQREDGWCARCGLQRGMEFHHRRPRGMGGTRRDDTNTASGCGFLCGDCHRWCESERTAARNEGWLVTQQQSPIDVPVLYRGAWVFLDNNGNLQRIEEVI